MEENPEARKYPYSITYEEILKYFEYKDDARSAFKARQIKQAINKQKSGYIIQVNENVTKFWAKYIELKNAEYSDLVCISKATEKGVNAIWPQFDLKQKIKKCTIIHKSDKGVLDLTFYKKANRTLELSRLVEEIVGDLNEYRITVLSTGGSAVIRIYVPELDFKQDFDEQIDSVRHCLNGVGKMYKLVEIIGVDRIIRFLE